MGEGNKLVDINQASLEELSIVPGLSTSLAEKVIASRPFENVNDLTRVRGIGPKSLLPMLPYLVVNALNEEQEPQTVQPPAIPSVITFDPVVGKTGKINQPPTEVDGSFSSQVRANNNTDNPQILEPSMVPISGVIPGSTNLLVFPGALNRHMDGPANNDESSGQTALPRSSNSTTSGTRANWSGGLNIESISLIIGTGILALILGIVFTLGILRVHNGTLSYASSSNYMALQVKLETITGQVNTLHRIWTACGLEWMRSKP